MTNTNKIVGLKLTAISKAYGDRQEIAGTTGIAYMTEKQIEDQHQWLMDIVISGEFDSHFEHYEIEAVKVFTETTALTPTLIHHLKASKAAA